MDKEQIESISLHMSSFSVDPVNKFKARNFFEDDQDDEIELSLGLSLNGKFGIDPKAKKLKRAASIPEFVDPSRLEEKARVVQMSGLGGGTLARTCSLPTEAEEEVRKRKEVQMLRRMEAKRKRNEKQRNLKLSREKSCEIVVNGGDGNGNSICSGLQQGKQSSGLPGWVCAAKGGCGNGLEGKPPVAPPLSQGSVGSQGTGSSGVTESDSHFSRGLNRHAEARSPASIQSLPDNEHKRTVACGEVVEKSGKSIGSFPMDNTSSNSKCDKELFTTLFRTMPCVSTQGDGPDGKRIEGFLYRYKKGEAVMIVCVCHGSFLTPAEFVKHAGGTDVTHPLRHIVVNPAPLL